MQQQWGFLPDVQALSEPNSSIDLDSGVSNIQSAGDPSLSQQQQQQQQPAPDSTGEALEQTRSVSPSTLGVQWPVGNSATEQLLSTVLDEGSTAGTSAWGGVTGSSLPGAISACWSNTANGSNSIPQQELPTSTFTSLLTGDPALFRCLLSLMCGLHGQVHMINHYALKWLPPPQPRPTRMMPARTNNMSLSA